VQVAAYNPHLGLPRSERCKVGHRTVYSDRREADVVMTSEVRWKLVHQEAYATRAEAVRRERFLKSWAGPGRIETHLL